VTRSCSRCGTRYPKGRIALCPVCLLESDIPAAVVADGLELLEEIGRGGMGVVYKGWHAPLGRAVAVKFLAEGPAGDPDSRRRLEREARLLARLTHPGIVAVHDLGQDGDRPFIVMEYVEGRPLSEALPLDTERAIDVALQACDALAYAHRHGVVHRDVKPANILIDGAGRVKITDFGIARLLDPEPTLLTAVGSLVGTPAYLPPEALAGAPPDPRMDVYSLGVVLCEMLSGRRPEGTLPPLPGGLAPIVARAVAPDPRQRYGSIDALRHDLLHLGSGVGVDVTDLAGEERNWLHAVALLLTLASAAVLWAFLLSVTPRVLSVAELQPLTMLAPSRLADGRIVSRARFETWPTLGALALVAAAVLGQGVLRRHWRQAGLERREAARKVRESRAVLACGVLAVLVYLARRLLEGVGPTWIVTFTPIVGGLIETAVLFLAWVVVLQAWRTSRPLAREAPFWLGLGLALLPPVIELTRFLLGWHPD
jgi:eukaryotic-like serine/threonine-protein kinase